MEYQHSQVILQDSRGSRLWLGDLQSAEDGQKLISDNILTVISVTAAGQLPNYGQLPIQHHKIIIRDFKNSNIYVHFQQAYEWIEQGLKKADVLVHCAGGTSRSPSIVIAYLMQKQRLTFQEALNYCRRKRPNICPNLGFERQLKIYQRALGIRREISKEPSRELSKDKQLSTDRMKKLPLIYYKKSMNDLPTEGKQHNSLHNEAITKRLVIEQEVQSGRVSKELQQYLKRMAAFKFGMTIDVKSSLELPSLTHKHN